tara:strand:+ start:2368 stop:3162 length:795 start_codon:yes stop_codon:yes gene_type:complete
MFFLTLGFAGVVIGAPFIMHDLANLGHKDRWSSFDKIRVKSYFEPLGLVGSMMPPIGPAKGIHHVSSLGDAYFDGDLPKKSTMTFLREVVMNSPGNGKAGNDFKTRFINHEKTALASGKKVYISNITQKVPFHAYGLPFTDHFAITMRTDIVDNQPKSSFIVWGLGAIADHRNPSNLGPQYNDVAKLVNLEGGDLIRWTCNLEREGIAKPYWVLITENDITSKFSHEAVHQKPSQRKGEWHMVTKRLHKSGYGMSVTQLYNALF